MKRYEFEQQHGELGQMRLESDGEWIRYEDHCEAMKRIAGEAERCKCCGYLVTESEHRGCLRAAAPSANGQQAEPVANNEAYDLAYDKIDRFLRSNLDDDDYAEFSRALDSLFAAPAPSASPAALTDEREAFEAWVSDSGRAHLLARDESHGWYADLTVTAWWSAWQARALLAASPTKENNNG